MTTVLIETCWCGGKKGGETKHRRRDEKACDASIADRRRYDKERAKTYDKHRNRVRSARQSWRPGTSILVEEIEQL